MMPKCSVEGCPQVADSVIRLNNDNYGITIPLCYGHLELARTIITEMTGAEI